MGYFKHLFDFRRLFQRKYLPHLNIYLFGMISLLCAAEWLRTGDSSYGYKSALGASALFIYAFALKHRKKVLNNPTPSDSEPFERKMEPLRKKASK